MRPVNFAWDVDSLDNCIKYVGHDLGVKVLECAGRMHKLGATSQGASMDRKFLTRPFDVIDYLEGGDVIMGGLDLDLGFEDDPTPPANDKADKAEKPLIPHLEITPE